LWAFFIFAGIGFGLWLASFVIEAIRPVPQPPASLRWAPDIKIDYTEAGGNKLRFIKSGAGPALVLLHTLRTQLDLFEKVVPDLEALHDLCLRLSRPRLFGHSKVSL